MPTFFFAVFLVIVFRPELTSMKAEYLLMKAD